MKQLVLVALLTLFCQQVNAQGTLTGDLQMNVNFFDRDSTINAENTPQYDNYLSGGEAWLSLRYNNKGFTAFLRADAFHNSNLYNPTQSFTGFGIGAFTLTKEIGDLTVSGGYIYDQIGSGILFRAYEDRGLLIDNALIGMHLKYKPYKNITVKAFTGQQKNIANFGNASFSRYNPIIKGINAEGDFDIKGKVHVSPGVGALNRTLDQESMNTVVSTINSQPLETRFVPQYNMYAFTAYNNLTWGNFSWYVEGAYKTHEAIVVDQNTQNLRDQDGNVVFSTLGYAQKGIAINLTGKRTENFEMRTSPNQVLLAGMLNWQPIVARLRPQRLMARYTPASQNLSELAVGGDILVAPTDELTFTGSYTRINTLQDVKLYREGYFEAEYQGLSKWKFLAGVQYLNYNQFVYQVRPTAGMVKAITPFAEVTYKFNSKKSLRVEVEQMTTEQDFGSWVYVLAEYNVAPRWSLALSDMYLTDPSKESIIQEKKHFYQAFGAYTKGAHRFTAAYVKQVEGINCTGGVCRYEPAFSGVRFGLTTSF